MRLLFVAAASESLAVSVIAGIVLIAACIGLGTRQSRSDPATAAKFKRLAIWSLGVLAVGVPVFLWAARRAGPVFRY